MRALCSLSAYLIVGAACVNAKKRPFLPVARSGHPREVEQATSEDSSGLSRATNDQDRVLAAEGADHLRPTLRVDGFGDRLSATRQRMENDELRDSINT